MNLRRKGLRDRPNGYVLSRANVFVWGEDHWPVKMFHPRSDAYRPLRIPQPSPLYKIQNGGNTTPSMGQCSIKRLEDKLKAWRRSLCDKYISFLQILVSMK